MARDINAILGITPDRDAAAAAANNPAAAVDPSLVGIGGWLILPAIGFAVGPFVEAGLLIWGVSMFSAVQRAGYGAIYGLELLVEIGMLGFFIYAATQFFAKKRDAPAVCIAFMAVGLVMTVVMLAIELSAGAEIFAIENGKQLVRGAIGAAIWILYFRVSRRVKLTFVN